MLKTVVFTILFLLPMSIGAQTDNRVKSTYLGASLYMAPLPENPRTNSNFTLTIKTDSLEQPINAITGRLTFNPDKLEIINVSKIGSIFNLWVEEPNYSNIEGRVSFQGGVPNPGFMGNGGTALHIIFKAKSPGITSLVWDRAEILAHDGKGTNILTNLQNYDFEVEQPLSPQSVKQSPPFYENPLVISNLILLFILSLFGIRYFISSILKSHDQDMHEHNLEKPNNPPPPTQ